MDPRKQKILEEWLKDRAQNKSRKRRKKELPKDEGVTINSLMDAVTIILIFLLMNFGTDILNVKTSEDLQLPRSTTTENPKTRPTTITITAKALLLDDLPVLTIKNDKLDVDDAESLVILKLKDELAASLEEKKAKGNEGDEKEVMLIVHSESPYEILYKVMVTAGSASFVKFKFAVVQGGLVATPI
jgi:biopolymer transport protein ExbD